MGKYNILIVEDHALTRFALKTAFESVDYVNNVFAEENAINAFYCIDKNPVDAVIMDLGLPNIDGIEATNIIKNKNKNIKVLILTSHENEDEVLKAIKAGASAYCSKDIQPEKLIEILQSVINGVAWFDPKVASYVLNAAASNEDSTPNEANDLNLTAREKQVLSLIADGLNNTEIAKKLDVSINTTKAHVCNILQKLSVQDRTQAAIKAIRDKII